MSPKTANMSGGKWGCNKNYTLSTPLFHAIQEQNVPMIKLLLDHKADLNQIYVFSTLYDEKKKIGLPPLEIKSALDCALETGNQEIISLIQFVNL